MEKAGGVFIRHFTVYGIAILALTVIVSILIPEIPVIWGLSFLIYAWVITVLFHLILIKSASVRKITFQNNFMMATGIKFLGYLLFLIVFLFFGRNENNLISFLLMFLSIYLLFSIFEVIYITRFFRDK